MTGESADDGERDEYDALVRDVERLASTLGRPPTTRDVRDSDDLPCLARLYEIIEDDWRGVLDDAGIEPDAKQVDRYDDGERTAMLRDLRDANERTSGTGLTTREYREIGAYATSTIKKTFDSWTAACEGAGIASGSKHGERCRGPEGEPLDSRLELEVAESLHAEGIPYEVHPTVEGTDWRCDFYLPTRDLWMEVDGYRTGNRPNAESFAEKIHHYETEGFDYLVVSTPEDVEEKLL